LSQLYQFRGIIDRGTEKACYYLFYKDKNLSDETVNVKKFETIKEFNELVSRFRLTLKDLKIRDVGGGFFHQINIVL
jgi:transcription-repair coupling factor (superfamily II helicase)